MHVEVSLEPSRVSDRAGSSNERVSTDDSWRPPSERLHLASGIWEAESTRELSYPDQGNDSCYEVEDASYWFRHRNACIVALMRRFPPDGVVYDIGGGNGYVTLGMTAGGYEAVLVEPGSGAHNGSFRGIRRVIHSTLEDAHFAPGSLDAAGAFDVVEHIEDDDNFIATIRDLLRPRGRLYCTVPALEFLWSHEDVMAGHFRRYTPASLQELLCRNGMRPEFMTPIFAWLVGPVFMCRTIPFRLGMRHRRTVAAGIKADHSLPFWAESVIRQQHASEIRRITCGRTMSFGTSLLCVARRL